MTETYQTASSRTTRRRRLLPAVLLALTGLLVGCDTTSPETGEQLVEGVDLEALFAPATAAEIEAVRADWAARDVSVQNLEIVAGDTVVLSGDKHGVFRVIAHTVDGVRHYGAIIEPEGAADGSLPVMVYAHPSDQGENVDQTIALFSLGINAIIDQFVYVVPSFRDEPLTIGGQTYRSEGPPSPWDYDVDDALALLDAALQTTPAADPERIGVLGFSRGGGVALLMAIRDPRIDLVAEFFGPTDFFDEDVRQTTAEALRGTPRDLPGMDYLDETFLQPLKQGALSIADVRLELVRRSPVLFAESLPQVQIQHGEADVIVSVSHARALEAALTGLGRSAPDLEVHYYPGAGHNPLEMVGSFDRLIAFVRRLLPVAV